MQQWTYMIWRASPNGTISLVIADLQKDRDFGGQQLGFAISTAGTEGWELVSTAPTGGSEVWMYFKRPR